MSKRIDHTKLNSKIRGRRDHDYDADAQRRREAEKKALEKFAARVNAGKRSWSKVARLSGPVASITGQAAAEIAARYNATPPHN